MSVSLNNKEASKYSELNDDKQAAVDVAAAAALINLSRAGSNLPEFTIEEAANILRVFGRQPEANPTFDRAAALVNRTNARMLIEWAGELGFKLPVEADQPNEDPNGRKANQRRKSKALEAEIYGDSRNAGAAPSTTTRRKRKSQDAELDSIEADATVTPTPKENSTIKRRKTKVSKPEVAEPRQKPGFVHVNEPSTQTDEQAQPRRNLRSSSRIPRPSLRAREASEAFSTSTVMPDTDEDAEEVIPEAESEQEFDAEIETEDESPASDTTTSPAPPAGSTDGPAPRKRRAVFTRNRDIIANRGHIEMFGMAVQNVVKRHMDSKHEHQIPDYSAPFSFPTEENKIADLLFAKDVKHGRVTATGMTQEKARAKYANIKKRCLFGAAVLFELNCHVEEAKSRGENPFPDMPPAPPSPTPAAAAARRAQAQANANVSDAAVDTDLANDTTTATPEASDNVDAHTTRSTTATPAPPATATATPTATGTATPTLAAATLRKSTLAFYEVNATRLQPSSGIDVTIVRPLFRAFRPVDDPTFIKPMSRGVSPAFESLVAGLLAEKGWFPAMVGKSPENGNGAGKARYVLVNRDWYGALGSKEERQWWLRKVLDEKHSLERAAVHPEVKKRMVKEREEAAKREKERVAAAGEVEGAAGGAGRKRSTRKKATKEDVKQQEEVDAEAEE